MTTGGLPAWDTGPLASSWPGYPPLDGDVACDLCVVGLGASGLAAVEWGVERGLDVVGVDAGRTACGAAGRNAGFLLGGAATAFHGTAVRWGVEQAVAVHDATLREIDRLERELGACVRRVGSLRIAGMPGPPRDDDEERDRDEELADCRVQLEAMLGAGMRAEWYDGPLGAGLWFPDDAAVDPLERCLRTARRVDDRARLHEGTAVREVCADPAPRVVHDRGSVRAAAVVVCIDGGLERVVPQLASRVRTVRLQMLATEPVPDALPCPVYARHGFDYAQQRSDGRLFVGGGRDRVPHEESADEAVTSPGVQAYLDALAPRFAGQPVRVTHRWAGLVGYSSDGVPVCELVDDGIAVAGGYDGTGNLIGPIAARAAAAAAVDGGVPNVPWSA